MESHRAKIEEANRQLEALEKSPEPDAKDAGESGGAKAEEPAVNDESPPGEGETTDASDEDAEREKRAVEEA